MPEIYISKSAVSYTHLRAHETRHDLVCRLLLEKTYQRKARECELATFNGNRRAVGMLNPIRDKDEITYRGEGTTPVTTACSEDR